jgi:hypothetical protein
VLEHRFTDERVDGLHRLGRVGGQGFVLHQQQAIPLRAVAGLLAGIVGAAGVCPACARSRHPSDSANQRPTVLDLLVFR